MGRLTAAPEVRFTQTGKAVAEFTIAVDSGYGDNKKTMFISCTAWESVADRVGNNLDKGMKILVEGEWQQQNWTTREGQNRRKEYCLVKTFYFCESKNKQTEQADAAKAFGGRQVFPQEEIPF